MGSEHSTRENGDGVQLLVKEHARSTSKGSSSSVNSRKRSSQGKYRPETKVISCLCQDRAVNQRPATRSFIAPLHRLAVL